MDKDFFVVRDYIYEHKQTNLDKVAEATEVSKQIILHLLKEGRLVLDDGSGEGGLLKCEVCGKSINSGRMCTNCKGKVANTMERSYSSRPSGTSKSGGSAAGPTSTRGSAKLKS